MKRKLRLQQIAELVEAPGEWQLVRKINYYSTSFSRTFDFEGNRYLRIELSRGYIGSLMHTTDVLIKGYFGDDYHTTFNRRIRQKFNQLSEEKTARCQCADKRNEISLSDAFTSAIRAVRNQKTTGE